MWPLLNQLLDMKFYIFVLSEVIRFKTHDLPGGAVSVNFNDGCDITNET